MKVGSHACLIVLTCRYDVYTHILLYGYWLYVNVDDNLALVNTRYCIASSP